MKNSLFNKIILEKVFKIFIIILILVNSLITTSLVLKSFGIDQNFYSHIINQALNSIPESACEKVNHKVIPRTFTDKFYSYDYCTKSLAKLPKLFTIISETDSEQNIRHSSFLFTQISTST